MSKEYDQKVKECAEQGRALMQALTNAGTIEPLYLYHRPSTTTQAGKLYLVRDSAPAPEGVELTTGEGLRGNVPYAHYFQWIHERARRAPVLSIEEPST